MKKVSGNIRVAALDALSDAIIKSYKGQSTLSNDPYLQPIMAKIETLSARITTAIKADKIYSQLEEKDSHRDEILRKIGDLLKGYMVFPMPEKQSVAKQLLPIFDKYKSIANERYGEESSHIESLLEDFGNQAAQVEKLDGLAGYLSELRSAQDAFADAEQDYRAALAGKSENASMIKKPLLSAINDELVPHLTLMERMQTSGFADFIKQVAIAIERAS